MALGTPYISDGSAVVINGVVGNLDATAMTTKFGAGNLRTPSRDFTYTYRGQTFHARKGVPIPVDAVLAAYFTSTSAPVT